MNIDTFLHEQTVEYQSHVSHIKELSSTLEQQQNMEVFNTIPKEYQPHKLLNVSSISLTEAFKKEYNELFLKHLRKVITNNQIELQLHKSALTSIIVQTELHLSKLPSPSMQVTSLYHKFVQDNKIEDRIAIPELQRKLQDDTPASNTLAVSNVQPKRRRRQKRKCPISIPNPTKHKREDHFLFPGPYVTPTLP